MLTCTALRCLKPAVVILDFSMRKRGSRLPQTPAFDGDDDIEPGY